MGKIRKTDQLKSLVNTDDYLQILFLWRDLDKDGCDEFLEDAFTDEVYKLKFICHFSGHWQGTSGRGWSFQQKEYKEFLNGEDVYRTITQMDKAKLIQFSPDEQLKLATFVLSFQKDEFACVDKKTAKKLVDKWIKG